MTINWFDILIIALIAVNIALGWKRGFILSILDLIRWIGSWLAALIFYKYVSTALAAVTDWTETWRAPLAFVFVLLVFSALIHAVGRRILRQVKREHHDHQINHVMGMIPGLANGLIIAALVSALMFSVPVSDEMSVSMRDSTLADGLAAYTEDLESALTPIFEPAVRHTLNRLTTIEPGSRDVVELPFKVENADPLPALEAQMLELVNQERIGAGLKPVEADPEMTEVARRHSADMFARGYFSHYTPEGKDPFDRMRDMNVQFRTAGENLALAPTLQIAHTGLMNSPGHRANILEPRFGRLGIGIMDGGRRGLMVTQKFRN